MEKQMAAYYNGKFFFDVNKVVIDLTNREGINKPMKAFWTSSVIEEDGYLSSDWVDFCVGDFYADTEIRPIKYIFVPKKGMKIYTIDTVEDYLSSELLKLDESSLGFSVLRKVLIDYEGMKKAGWDGIHFTSNGARLGHNWRDETIPEEVRDALYCIDVESTVWFRPDWFKSVVEEDSWFDYTWDSVRYGFPWRTVDWRTGEVYSDEEIPWYENYNESDCGHLLLA